MRSTAGLLPTVLVVVLGLSTSTEAASPPVQVSLRSSWPAHNLVPEFLETAALHQPSLFFPLVDLLTNPSTFPKPLSTLPPEAIHQVATDVAQSSGLFREPDSFSAFQLALALHSASPKLEAFHQYYKDRNLGNISLPSGTLVEECGSWVDWYGNRICTRQELAAVARREALDPIADNSKLPSQPVKILPFDHTLPDPSTTIDLPLYHAVLYANLTSPNFRELHTELLALSTALPPKLTYIFRYVPPNFDAPITREYLSGYGVGLDLKKTDYLVMDDRFAKRKDTEESSSDDTSQQVADPILNAILAQAESVDDIDLTTALTKDELSDLGPQAISFIKNSSDPFKTLISLSSDFPRLAIPLSRLTPLSEPLTTELRINAHRVAAGSNMFWLNGMYHPEHEFNPFSILNKLRSEREIMGQLTQLGLSPKQALDVLSSKHVQKTLSQGTVLDGVFDASDRAEGGDVIVWLNDLEKDEQYASMKKSLRELAVMRHPGQFPSIALNLYNIILAVDMSNRHTLTWIYNHVSNLINRKFTLRWGLVPLVDTPESAKAARLFRYVYKHYGPVEVMDFIRSLIAAQQEGDTVDFLIANAFFNNLAINVLPLHKGKVLDPTVSHDFDVVIAGTEEHVPEAEKKVRGWSERLDVQLEDERLGVVFVNGKWFKLDPNFLPLLQEEIMTQSNWIREYYFNGHLQEGDSVENLFYDLPTTPKRRNRYLYPSSEPQSLRIQALPQLMKRINLWDMDYVWPETEGAIHATTWIIGDLDDEANLCLLKEALKGLDLAKSYRLSFTHSPSTPWKLGDSSAPRFSTLLYQLQAAYSKTSPSELLTVLEEALPDPVVSPSVGATAAALTQGLDPNPPLDDTLAGTESQHAEPPHRPLTPAGRALLERLNFTPDQVDWEGYKRWGDAGRLFAREVGLKAGESGIVVNGRVLGPIHPGGFRADDFGPLVAYEIGRRVGAAISGLSEVGFSAETWGDKKSIYTDIVTGVSSIISAVHIPDPMQEGLFQQPVRPRARGYKALSSKHIMMTHGDPEIALFNFAFLLDPLSETGQRWGPLIKWLTSLEHVHIEVYLHTSTEREEMPLKRFYRSCLRDKLTFDEAGNEIPASIQFDHLPVEPIYTLAMEVPQSWLVRPRESIYDLDNIYLASLTGSDRITGVRAVFELDFLVIEGHTRDTTTGYPPRGLQLQLTKGHDNIRTPIADTQVVENLGYFQFKAKPGVFQMEIREGRGQEVYHMESVGNAGWNSPSVEEVGLEVTVTSFEGLTLYPRFTRQAGQLKAEVLKPKKKALIPGLIDKVVTSVSALWKGENTKEAEADINIFTVASGHLYERFASIMTLSVMKHTNSTVKFWFIENFLSPAFLEFVPHLAEEYGFQYELVTYKWPSWLRAQREKQRVIWGYKILFLDVLFPMDLKKVIFVDADQIVRTDLKELVDLDLHGAPYGYTPMGDDNEAMEGFRFWKTGYWEDFLKGKPYHISALYVIDLVRFRMMAAGDRLRGLYQGLSADPNSLANLDQDLPNNLQHEIPIFSLDKDWLWCETWCSMDRFEQAKTIDLCQNPLTKEPKLARARQIPEWSAYDGEIARFARRLSREGKISSTALSEEVDELATVGGKKGKSKDVEVPKVGLSVIPEGDSGQTVVNNGDARADRKPHIEL